MRHKAQKSVKTSSNVPYCKAVRIRDDARNLVGPRKSARSVCSHENCPKRPFSKKHVRRPHPVRSTGPSGVLLVGVSVHIQAT